MDEIREFGKAVDEFKLALLNEFQPILDPALTWLCKQLKRIGLDG